MKYLSVCSGIEAATVAWHGLGWEPVGFAEIDPFASAVLAHHYPTVPNFGDLNQYASWPLNPGSVDLLVGGTPCQSFSVAGLREGLADPRGNLALVYLGLLDRLRPQWFVWENVPGVLSSNGGRDFGAFLGALGELGYGFAYRVLDAQHFRVAQRRRRVFVVGHAGDWRRAAAVLFERESMCRHPAPSKEARQEASSAPAKRAGASVGFQCSLGSRGGDAYEDVSTFPKHGSKTLTIGFYHTNRQPEFGNCEDLSPTIKVGAGGTGGQPPAVVYAVDTHNQTVTPETCGTLRNPNGTFGDALPAVFEPGALVLRRLTPRECERLQGFPDDYTLFPYRGKPAADGPRYKALGNSMAVPVMAWIGRRVDALTRE